MFLNISKQPPKAQNSFKWLKIAPNSFKWAQICLTGSHWVQKRQNWSKWIQMGLNGSKGIHMGGYLLQYIPSHLLNLFLNGSLDYNITLLVYHPETKNCQAKFYFPGDFLDMQCPYMTKALFLFFKEKVVNLHNYCLYLLHFNTKF